MLEDDPPPKPAGYRLGDNLDVWSVGDLRGLIDDLRGEIARVEAELQRKEGRNSAAESLFKS